MVKRIGRRAGEGYVDTQQVQDLEVVDGTLTLNGTELANLDGNLHISPTPPAASESSEGDIWVKF